MNTLFPDVPCTFPNEIANLIFQNLSPQEITQKVSLVCKRWKELSDDDQTWKPLYFKHFGADTLDFQSWKLKFQEGYECLFIADQLFQDLLTDKMTWGTSEFNKMCDEHCLKFREFKWTKSCPNSEIIPIFIRFHYAEHRRGFFELPITNHFHYVIQLLTHENLNAFSSKKNCPVEDNKEPFWYTPGLNQDKVIARINNVEKLLNDKLNSYGESAFQHNRKKMLTIKGLDSYCHLNFDLNCKITNIYETADRVRSICKDYYHLDYDAPNVFHRWGASLSSNPRNRWIISTVMDYCIQLLRNNQL